MKFELNEQLIKSETREYLEKNPDSLAKVLDLGVYVLTSVQASKDVEIIKNEIEKITILLNNKIDTLNGSVESRIKDMLTAVDKKITAFPESIQEKIDGQFNPDDTRSYTAKFAVYLREKAESFKQEIAAKTDNLKEQLSRVESQTSEKEGSLLSNLKKQVEKTQEFIVNQFNDTNTESYAYQLKTKLSETFGQLGEVIAESVRKEMVEAQKPIIQQITELISIVSKRLGFEEAMDKTAIKGFDFEDTIQDKLENIAKNYSDRVEVTALKTEITGSKKGDFVYTLGTNGERIIIEAKDKAISLKESQDYMKEASSQRGISFGILVCKTPEQLQKQIGRWNIYDNLIICCADDIEISLKVMRLNVLLRSKKEGGVNLAAVKGKMDMLQAEMKRFPGIKTQLTNLKNATDTGVNNIGTIIVEIQTNITQIIIELEKELK